MGDGFAFSSPGNRKGYKRASCTSFKFCLCLFQGAYYEPQGGVFQLARDVFRSAKKLISGFQEVHIFVFDGCVWETHPYMWCTTCFVDRKLFKPYRMG